MKNVTTNCHNNMSLQNVATNFQYKLLKLITAKLVANEGQLLIEISFANLIQIIPKNIT